MVKGVLLVIFVRDDRFFRVKSVDKQVYSGPALSFLGSLAISHWGQTG